MLKIGIFDSGLGGLLVLQHLQRELPEYDYVFFGDQANVPYGNKTVDELMSFAKKALTYLYKHEECKIVLLACNTTSSTIYEELKLWAQSEFEGRLVFGVVRPTVEALKDKEAVVFFGTRRTVMSHAYKNALPNVPQVYEIALPELATLIESGDETLKYISLFKELVPSEIKIGALVCTHYGIVKEDFKKIFPHISEWVLQEEIVPEYFVQYLREYPEIKDTLSREASIKIIVSADSSVFRKFLKSWFTEDLEVNIINV